MSLAVTEVLVHRLHTAGSCIPYLQMPFILCLFLIDMASGSSAKSNRRVDNGTPAFPTFLQWLQ